MCISRGREILGSGGKIMKAHAKRHEMTPSRPINLTLLDILQRRRGTGFVGRSQFVQRFQQNLALPVDSPERHFIFAISGESGVGKSWLMRHLHQQATLAQGVRALWANGHADSPLAIMAHLAEQLAQQGLAMPTFAPAYQAYCQNSHLLAENLDSTSGVRFFLADKLLDSPMQWQHRARGWGIAPTADLTALFEAQRQARRSLARQILPDEQAFLQVMTPVAELTPLWLQDIFTIAQSETVAFFLDAVDAGDGWLEKWLLQVLTGVFGPVPAQSLWLMASTSPPDAERWLPLAEVMEHFALAPFTPDQAHDFLLRYSNDEPVSPVQAELPLTLSVRASFRQIFGRDSEGTDLTDILTQLYQALPPEKQRFLLAAGLPRQLNPETLAAVLGDDATAAYQWLQDLPLARPSAQGARFHPRLRRAVLTLARAHAPELYDSGLSQLALRQRRLAGELKLAGPARWAHLAWRERWLEQLGYHLLQSTELYLGMALDAVLPALELNPAYARALAHTLQQAGEDGAGDELVAWAQRIRQGADALASGNYQKALNLLDALIASDLLEPHRMGPAHAFRAWLLRCDGQVQEAVAAYESAEKEKPALAWVPAQRAATYFLMDQPQKAREVLSSTLEAFPENDWALALAGWFDFVDDDILAGNEHFTAALTRNPQQTTWGLAFRAEAHRLLGQPDEALSDLNRVMAQYPDRAWLHALRSAVLCQLDRADEALADNNWALRLQPDSAWMIALLGQTLEQVGRPDDALDAYSRALELAPDSVWTLTQRGALQNRLGRHQDALTDLDKAVALNATDAAPLMMRALLHQSQVDHQRAVSDFDAVIAVQPDNLQALRLRAQSRAWLGHYEDAVDDLTRALKQDPQNVDLLVARSEAFAGLGQVDDALTDINAALSLRPDEPDLLVHRADLYLRMGRHQAALDDLNAVLATQPRHARALAHRGDAYRQMGEDEKAVSDFARALAIDPDDGWTLARRADVYRRMDRYQEALADFARALAIDHNDAWALAHRGETYRQMEDFDLALKDFTRSLEMNPRDYWAWAGRGETYCQLDQLELGIEDFSKALELQPDDPMLLELRGSALAELDRNEEALADYDRAMISHPDQGILLTLRGDLLLKMREFERSEADLNQALTLNPSNVDALVARGRLLRTLQRYKDALVDLDRAIALRPKDAWAMAYRGEVHRLLKRYHASLTDLSGALALLYDDPWILAQRGETYRLLGMYGEALDDLTRSLELRPNDIWTLATRGQVLRTLGRYDEALDDFSSAIQLSPHYAWAYASRGETLRVLKRYDRALNDLNRALELDPAMPWALVNRGQVHLAQKNAEAAERDFDQAVSLNPNYAWALAGRGQAARMLGQLDAALDDFHQAIAINPNFVWALVNRGHVFRLKGEYQRALADFDRAVSLDPHNAWAMAGRAQVNRALQRYDEAQSDISNAIALTPELDVDLFRRAITQQLKGDVEGARNDLDEAIGIAQSVYELDPENWRNVFNLALYFLARGRRALAERHYREALSAPAPTAEITRAQRTLEDYLALFPDNNVARTMLELINDYLRN